jgi:hypothetical protein
VSFPCYGTPGACLAHDHTHWLPPPHVLTFEFNRAARFATRSGLWVSLLPAYRGSSTAWPRSPRQQLLRHHVSAVVRTPSLTHRSPTHRSPRVLARMMARRSRSPSSRRPARQRRVQTSHPQSLTCLLGELAPGKVSADRPAPTTASTWPR